jgi:ABC-type proline/glycine betaine transport system permease subunit
MKNLLMAIAHDFEGLVLLVVLIVLMAGLIALIVFVAGEYSTAIFLGILLVEIQFMNTWERIQALKKRNKK